MAAEDELAASLQAIAISALQDIADVQSNQKGKSREGLPRSDAQLALDIFAEEANALLSTARDFEIAVQLEKAMRLDAPILEEHRAMEERASRDREMALALSQGRAPPPRPPTTPSPDAGETTPQIVEIYLRYDMDDGYVVYGRS